MSKTTKAEGGRRKAEKIDRAALGWICNSSLDDARRWIRSANAATLMAALENFNARERKDPRHTHKSYRKLISIKLRQLDPLLPRAMCGFPGDPRKRKKSDKRKPDWIEGRKSTQGWHGPPWTISRDDGTAAHAAQPEIIIENEGAHIGFCFGDDMATAQLIHAAPEMFDALEDIVKKFKATRLMVGADLADSIRVFGKKAIAKALGKGVRP